MRARSAAALRWCGRILLVLLVVILVLVGSLLLAPTRSLWLDGGAHLAWRSLPGQVQGDWSWPRLDRLEGRDLVWTAPGSDGAGADTLAVIRRLAVQVDLKALLGHQLKVGELALDAALLDVPRIMAHLPAPAPAAGPAPADSAAAGGFLHPGSLPGFPSVALASVGAAVSRLVLPSGVEATDLTFGGSASALAGDRPQLILQAVTGKASSLAAPRWSMEMASLAGAMGYDRETRTATLDSLVGRILAATADVDTLHIRAGPLDLAARGTWRDGVLASVAELRFSSEVPAPLQNPIQGIELRGFSGRLTLDCRGTAAELAVGCALDLDPSPDLSRGRLRGTILSALQPKLRVRQAQLEELVLQWRQSLLEVHGVWDGQTVAGRLQADMQNLELPRLLIPGLLEGVAGRVKMTGTASGPALDPRIEGTINARMTAASIWSLPGAAAAGARLPADFPRGEFQRLDLDLDADLAGTLTQMDLEVRADLGRTPWLGRGLLVGGTRLDPRARAMGGLRLDTLAVALRGFEVECSGTADTVGCDLTASVAAAGTGWLDLAAPGLWPGAELGLQADLQVGGPWRDLGGEADLGGRLMTADFALPELAVSARGSAADLDVRARAGGGIRLGTVVLDSLVAGWAGRIDPAGGLPPGRFEARAWAPQAAGWLRGSATGDSVRTAVIDTLVFTAAGQTISSAGPVTLVMGPGPRDLSVTRLHLRGDQGRLDVDGSSGASGVSVAADTELLLTREWLGTLFPSPFWSASGGVDLAIEGAVTAATTAAARSDGPVIRGQAELRLIPRNEDPPARLGVDFHLAREDTAGLVADFRFGVGETHLVRGSLLWSGRIDPVTGRWQPAVEAAGDVRIPEQELPLAFFNRFLPGEVSLDGDLTVGAGLEVARGDSSAAIGGAVSGLVRAQGLRVNLPNRSRVDLDGQVGLEGKLVDPRLTGKITVTSGLFRLPEPQRALLPVTGSSALWTAAGEAAADSAAPDRQPVWVADEPLPPPAPAYIPDLDLKVIIPGNFKVTGYGLEIELAGDCTVSRGWDPQGRPAPALRGRIRVVEGTLRALNRVFEVERGEFDLEGRIPADPTVNLVLVTDIDGTIVRIRVTGTALQPKIVLESEPEMIQADIMAFLVFGRPLNDLDTDQRGSLQNEQTASQQLRQNLQGLALVFGAAGIQNKISGKIGVDQVQIGSDTAGGSTLVLGKFINPRILLKYHQSLERSGTYFMTLEYTLSRVFKLISTYGQGEEASGLELRWQRRY